LLGEFLDFADQKGGAGPIRAEWALDWACLLSPRRGVSGQAGRLSVVRNFLTYLQAFITETEVPHHGLLSGPNRRKPYLFSADEVRSMLAATMELGPRNSLRPHTYNALLGLLASTGLRVGEAIRLTVADVQLTVIPPHLIIRETKFAKSRLVPLHPTAAEHLRRYGVHRQRLGYDTLSDAWLISEQGGPLLYSSLWIWFAISATAEHSIGRRKAATQLAFVSSRLCRERLCRGTLESMAGSWGRRAGTCTALGRLSWPRLTARDLLVSECHTGTVECRCAFV
jgi:integrase